LRTSTKEFAGERFRSGQTNGRKREGASTVSFNHQLAAKSKGSRRNMGKLQYVFIALAALCFAIPAFADGGSAAINLVPIGAGIGMALAAGLCGLGQGKATASACEALARNPGARAGIQLLLVLGLAFIESLTLFTLVIIFAKVKI
jgi:F-type H+-transporting ATPase subunit c